MSLLFDKGVLGTLETRNRFVRSATWEGMCEPDGSPTERLAELYESLVEGGVGLIITGYTYVSPEGKQLPGKMGLYDDCLVDEHSKLVERVHRAGGKIAVQLVHAGGQATRHESGIAPIAPSAVEFPTYAETPREMTREDVVRVIEDFAKAAGRAKRAGYDGVQLHAAHGYLINQFLSPLTNRRRDEYGGSLENRARFLLDVVRAVRNEVGDSYPLFVKLSCDDFVEGGFSIEEAEKVASMLEREGVAAIEVSGGSRAAGDRMPARLKIDAREKEAYHRELARRIGKKTSLPLLLVGGLRSFELMDEIVSSGDAEFVSMSRPFIREPALVRKFESGGGKAECISCNGCFGPGLKEGGIYCVVVRAGRG